MRETTTIRMTGPSGLYEVTPEGLDRAIEKYLPASLNDLRAILLERVYGSQTDMAFERITDYDDVWNVSDLLMRLADMDEPNKPDLDATDAVHFSDADAELAHGYIVSIQKTDRSAIDGAWNGYDGVGATIQPWDDEADKPVGDVIAIPYDEVHSITVY